MDYLYGDSTPSPLKSNFLEFLRDATDFAVFVLQADDRIARGKARLREAEAAAQTELERLEKFVALVSRAIHEGEKGAADSPASRCGARLAAFATDAHHATIEEVRRQMADLSAELDAEEGASRSACRDALAKLLVPHDPHEADITIRLTTRAAGPFDARLAGQAKFGLDWTFELATEEADPWRAPLRLDALAPQLEIRAPQLTGWISKEVKVRPQKIDRHFVTELVDDGAKVVFKLRAEIGADVGFDIEVDPESKRVKMTRLGPSDDASVGAFDVHEEDVAPIVELAKKLRASARTLPRRALVEANVDGAPFKTLPVFADLVERLVYAMAPVVITIAERSLTPNELVLRRLLGDDRREELFVPKAVIREKYAVLPKPLARLFLPLGLEQLARSMMPPRADVELDAEPPPIRAQIAPSRPPPPPIPSSAPPRVPTARPPVTSTAAAPPPATPPTGSAPERESTRGSAPSIEITSEEDVGAAPEPATPEPGPLESVRLSSSGGTRNEALRSTLKKIALLMRSGQTEEAFAGYAELFDSAPFADYRPDDQRQALRLMVLSKSPPADKSEVVLAAHRAAAARLEALVAALRDPVDYEMLGVTQIVLGDEAAAEKALRAGLEIEREKSPSSDLCGTLMRRLSAL